MAIKAISKCYSCGYPLAIEDVGQTINCPDCGSINQSISAVSVPDWVFWGGLGIVAGFIIGKSKFASKQFGRI